MQRDYIANALKEANEAFENGVPNGPFSLGLDARDAFKANKTHATEKLASFRKKMSECTDTRKAVHAAIDAIARINIEEPERTTSTDLQRVYLTTFLVSLQAHAKETTSYSDTPEKATPQSSSLSSTTARPLTPNHKLSRPNEDTTQAATLPEAITAPPLAADAKSKQNLASQWEEDLTFAHREASNAFTLAAERSKASFANVNKAQSAETIDATFNQRLSKATHMLFMGKDSISTRLMAAKTPDAAKLILLESRIMVQPLSRTTKPMLNAYLDGFSEALASRNTRFTVEKTKLAL